MQQSLPHLQRVGTAFSAFLRRGIAKMWGGVTRSPPPTTATVHYSRPKIPPPLHWAYQKTWESAEISATNAEHGALFSRWRFPLHGSIPARIRNSHHR